MDASAMVKLNDISVSMRLERMLPDGAPHGGTRRGVLVLAKDDGSTHEIPLGEHDWERMVDWVASTELYNHPAEVADDEG